ncbi:hypothetical protein [Candidatus Vidania fulgoroideorum]
MKTKRKKGESFEAFFKRFKKNIKKFKIIEKVKGKRYFKNCRKRI